MEILNFLFAMLLLLFVIAIVSVLLWASFTFLPNETFPTENDDIEKS